jgi:hypothetical protein
VFANLVADILYAVVDPRADLSRGGGERAAELRVSQGRHHGSATFSCTGCASVAGRRAGDQLFWRWPAASLAPGQARSRALLATALAAPEAPSRAIPGPDGRYEIITVWSGGARLRMALIVTLGRALIGIACGLRPAPTVACRCCADA